MPTERQPILEVKYVRTNTLIPLENNPRTIDEPSFKILCDSLRANRDYLTVRPLLITPDNVVFAGNMRLKAAQHIGMEEVPVAVMDISEERRNEICIRDNVQNGIFDADILNNAWDSEKLMEWGVDIEEFGIDEGGGAQTAGDDDVPEGGVGTPLTVVGDLYEIKTDHSTVRLICGDTTSLDVVNKVMSGELAHLAVSDPPYNVGYTQSSNAVEESGESGQIMNDSMSQEDFRQFMRDAFTSFAAAMLPGAHIYSFMSTKEWGIMMQVLPECGFWWSNTIIWNKSHAVMSRGDFHNKMEPCFYGWKEGAPRLCPLEDRTQNNVWDIDRPTTQIQHPTAKPVAIYERATKNSSHEGDNVIDFFAGSGSGAIACIKTKRNFFGIELDPKFVDRIISRIHRFAGENSIEYQITRNGQPFNIADIGDVPTEARN
jgi:DNA modification methylase